MFWMSQAEILVKSIGIGIEVLDFGPVLVLVLVLTLKESWVLVLVLVLTSGLVQVLVLVLVLTFGGMWVLVLVLILTSVDFWYWYWYWPLKNGIAGVWKTPSNSCYFSSFTPALVKYNSYHTSRGPGPGLCLLFSQRKELLLKTN